MEAPGEVAAATMEVATTAMEGVEVAGQQQQQGPQAVGDKRSPFTFQPTVLLADLVNMALETCADAFDRFEEAVAGTVDVRPEHRQALLEGIGVLYECAAGSLDQACTNFQRLAEATILRVPPELYLEQAAAAPAPLVAPEEEQALDAELAELRGQIEEAKRDCKGLRQQLRDLNRDLAAAGDASAFGPLSGALSTQRGALLEDSASVGGALLRLGPLLARAREVLATPAATGPGAKAPSACDAAAGAQRRIAAAQQDTGASVDQLMALQESLTTGTQ